MSEDAIPVQTRNWLTPEEVRQRLGLKSVQAVTKRCRVQWQKQGLAVKYGDGNRGVWKIDPKAIGN